jgi:NAD(P)-dependent dehydrogenase (short-subunit alcohol dehydrogenase family)
MNLNLGNKNVLITGASRGIGFAIAKSFLQEVNAKIPMGRMANADEYQGTLLWMLSDASSYLNGAIVPVDGGRTAW